MQKDRVEHMPGCWRQAKGDVGDSERGLHPGKVQIQKFDGFDCFDAVSAGFILASGNRKGKGVDRDVDEPHAPVFGEVFDQSRCDGEFGLGCAGLTFLVNG